MTQIVKQGGHVEPFNGGKLYQSLYSTMLSSHTPPGAARLMAQRTVDEVRMSLEKPEITSADLRRMTAEHLSKYNLHAAHTYFQQDTKPHFQGPYAPDPTPHHTSFLHQQTNPHSHWWEADRRDY